MLTARSYALLGSIALLCACDKYGDGESPTHKPNVEPAPRIERTADDDDSDAPFLVELVTGTLRGPAVSVILMKGKTPEVQVVMLAQDDADEDNAWQVSFGLSKSALLTEGADITIEAVD